MNRFFILSSRFRFLSILLLLVLFVTCDKEIPIEPPRNNPVDSNNPATNGDPYNLQA